jgi:hypothetical protein
MADSQTAAMKVISVGEVQAMLLFICEEVLGGEVVWIRLPNDQFVKLTADYPLACVAQSPIANLADSYADREWANFENRCAMASD